MNILSQAWKGFLKWKRRLTSEKYRRFALRLTTTLLLVIIGPAMAWDALEVKGILIYLAINTIAKWASSSFAAKNTKIANFAYRWASIFALLLATLLGALVYLFELQIYFFTLQIPTQYSDIIVCGIVPLLFGIFEGSFWASFLGILAAATERKRLYKKTPRFWNIVKSTYSTDGISGVVANFGQSVADAFSNYKDKGIDESELATLSDEQYRRLIKIPMTLDFEQDIKKNGAEHPGPDGESANEFQLNEVLATVSVAILVWFMARAISDDVRIKLLSCIIGLVLIIIAISWRIGKNHLDNAGNLIRRDRSPLKDDKKKRVNAKIISGIFGIMQLSVAWSMKVFALSYGGVGLLAIFLGVAEIVGFFLVDILPKFWRWLKEFLNDNPASVWIAGHFISLLGIFIMAWGAVEDSKLIFLIGWCFSQGAIRGMLRGREIIFSNQHLQCKPVKNDEIGLRERTKFIFHFLYVFAIICCYALCSYIGYNTESLVIGIMLFCGALCAMVELVISFPITFRGTNLQLVPRQNSEN